MPAAMALAAARVPFLERDLSERALHHPPERLFTEADLVSGSQDAYAAGRAAGLAEAAASRQAEEAKLLDKIAHTLQDSASQASQIADQSALSLARTVIEAVGAVLPNLIKRSSLAETNAVLAAVLPGLARQPQVEIIIPRDILAGVDAALAKLPPPERSRITLTESGELGPGDVIVRWDSGYAERRPRQVCETVMRTLVDSLGNEGGQDLDHER